MTITGRLFTLTLLAAAIASGVYYYNFQSAPSDTRQARPGQGPGRSMRDDGPVPVVAALSKRADVPVYFEGVGTTRPLNTVTVRPQVDGRLIGIDFKEGQEVKRGDVLARLDPATYQAQLDQAVAKKAQDEALLENAKLDLARYGKLAESNSVARQQLDTQKSVVSQFEAQVRLDQAAIDNARAILQYTTIRAPHDGRTGIRLVDEGNLVRGSDATGIVVITQLQPIAVLFTLPQQQLSDVNRAFAEGKLTVDAFGGDNRTIVDNGVLQVIDNQVDQTTGTVKLKAEFPNTKFQLWPGQFVNVRLLVDTRKNVVVAPTSAIQRGPNGTFVFVVGADSTVVVRPVSIAMQDENQAVIASGIDAGERIVTTGFARLTAGSRVTVTDADTAPPAANVPIAQPRRERRPGAGPGDRPNRRSEAQSPNVTQ